MTHIEAISIVDTMKQALELLTSAHVATDLVWKRHDCCESLRQAIANAESISEAEHIKTLKEKTESHDVDCLCSYCEAFDNLQDQFYSAGYTSGFMDASVKAHEADKQEPDKYAMEIECTKCGATQSGILTVNTHPPQRSEDSKQPKADPTEGNWYAAEDIDKMVRELDVLMNGKNAASQSMLCDLMPQLREKLSQPKAEQEQCEYCKRGLKTICLCNAQPKAEKQDWKTLPTEDPPLVKWAKEHTISQPKREWVGLTGMEIDALWDRAEKRQAYQGVSALAALIQGVEAKLKEKNT